MIWNVLVVDDDSEQAETTAELISGNKIFKDTSIKCTVVTKFSEALEQIEYTKFDLLVLDLNDDTFKNESAGSYSGQKVLDKLRGLHFTPVIFYTGFAHAISYLESPFVKVVTKGSDPAVLRSKIKEVFDTQLPQLLKHIQEEQRKYLWDHIESAWLENKALCDEKELAFLLARRLANALGGDVIRKFFNLKHTLSEDIAHPIELYIWPPLGGETIGFGDIIEKAVQDEKKYFIVLNPACDFAQCKAEKALLAECADLTKSVEYMDVQSEKAANLAKKKPGQDPEPISKTKANNLGYLLKDNRKGTGVQPDRYKFLPKTTFLPGMIIDYQALSQVPVGEITEANGFKRVATLDTPYAESVQSRFIRYYGRIGTPDLEFDELLDELIRTA